MGGHHKKKLRAEKAKVKLKGAKLPKGLNVTKTEFKVRKITLRDQLKGNTYEPGAISVAQINLKETLSRLKHNSSSFRQDALKSLREALNAEAAHGILAQLGDFIQAISAVCLDLDKEARRESFKTLSTLLSALPQDSVAPFFHVISSYLRCAMTHIQAGIQEDALLMLDVLLQHVPQLVAQNSNKIFQNFLEMISRVRSEGDKADRTLTVQMGQQQTSVKWRFKVLQRLQQMLSTLVQPLNVAAGKTQAAVLTFNNNQPQYYSLKRQYADQGVFEFNTNMASTATANTSIITASDEAQILRGYISHLLPLLFEAWLEVRPQISSASTSQILLSADAAISLKVILEIIANLWSLVDLHEAQVNNQDLSQWFRAEYANAFASNFMQKGFPYQQVEGNTIIFYEFIYYIFLIFS